MVALGNFRCPVRCLIRCGDRLPRCHCVRADEKQSEGHQSCPQGFVCFTEHHIDLDGVSE